MKNETTLAPANSFQNFIGQAIEKGVPVDTLERLLAMQKEIMAANAKAAYDEALSQFQKECPIIHKGKAVMNKGGAGVRYSYAPMDSIISQVREPLAKHGFSYDVDTEIVDQNGANWIKAIVTATHVSGHSKTKTFMVPVDKDAFMNEQQKVAAARTYALRYCFTGIFGIMTGDEDDDTTSIESPKCTCEGFKQNPTCPVHKKTPETTTKNTPESSTSTPIDGKLTVIANIVNVENLPVKKQNPSDADRFRYKLTLADQPKPFYSFDKKVRELCSQYADSGPATIVYQGGKYGQDIDEITFEAMPKKEPKPPLDEYRGELEGK